jgi:hypothetical protein
MKMGSLYSEDMRRLEEAEKREQDVKYDLKIRELNYRSPRRPKRTLDEDTVRPGSPSK